MRYHGLKDVSSSLKPSASANSSSETPASSIMVVSGVTTLAPAGADKVIPDKVAPDELSTVSSVTAIILDWLRL